MKLFKILAILTSFLCCMQGTILSAYAAEEAKEDVALGLVYPGDADLSGTIDIRDVILVNRSILGKSKLSDMQQEMADINKDGDVTPADALDIMKKIVGIIPNESKLTSKAVNLSEAVKSQEVSGKTLDEPFVKAQTEFYLNLFKKAEQETPEENIFISPYSAMQALAMTANGANGSTKTGMENALGGLPLDELNQYLYTQRTTTPNDEKCKLNTVNSIWYRNNFPEFDVKPEFLQKNADYYGADAFSAPFDDSTVSDINNWCKTKTEGMIPQLLEEIPEDAMMYLINAVTFDGKWEIPYDSNFDVLDGRTFTAADGTEQTAEMLYSENEYEYLSDEHAEGFYKPYSGGKYAFAAILPEEGMTAEEYLSGLTAESLQNMLANPESKSLLTMMPKFSYDYEIKLNSALAEMGMEEAFTFDADFTNMSENLGDKLYISEVLHKTHIDVTPEGTSAAAVTSVQITIESVRIFEKNIILDRPFIYMIVDRETCLPVFMGILNKLN